MRNYLGIEIGGTKLQVGVGPDDGKLRALWRGTVNPAEGPDGIRRQILAAVPEVLTQSGLSRSQVHGVGIGFGGPVDDATNTVIKSHQIDGWDNFPLANWIGELVGVPAALGNDADVAGLAEARHGAGKDLSPIFYITIGSGIGGGLILDGQIYRGQGRGAAEIGHCIAAFDGDTPVPLEQLASGWAIGRQPHSRLPTPHTASDLAQLARQGDEEAHAILHHAWHHLAVAISRVIALLCPRRVILGGGVSLMGELLFEPLPQLVQQYTFEPFRGLTELVAAALGEEVVVHGAIALAAQKLRP